MIGNTILYKLLLESEENISESEYQNMDSLSKSETLKGIIKTILDSVRDKVDDIDMTFIDRSRGDLKQLRELPAIQDAINYLQALLEKYAEENVPEECTESINILVKSILYMNKYTNEFKEAYRTRKTLLILKYESLVLSVVSALTYLISVIVDSRGGDIKVKRQVHFEKIAPIKNLEDFIKSVDNGTFNTMIRDSVALREAYNINEVSKEDIRRLLEPRDFPKMLSDGLESFIDKLNSSKLPGIIYKIAGIAILIISLREIFYMIANLSTPVSEMLNHIKNFANINTTGALGKLSTFGNRFAADAENASNSAKYEISSENRNIRISKPTDALEFNDTKPSNDSGNSGFDLGF